MFYEYSFTIPANTSQAEPEELVCPLAAGIINYIAVLFPAGCAGLAYLQIKRALHHIAPVNPDGAFNSNDEVIAFDEHFELSEQPFQVELVGWNLDDTFVHTLEVRFGVEEQRLISEEVTILGRFKSMFKALGV